MSKPKRKLTLKQKSKKKRRKKEFMYVFMNGRQVRVKRPQMIDGIPVDEFIIRNADPIWLQQNEMWELIEVTEPIPENFCSKTDNEDDPIFLKSNDQINFEKQQ